MFSPDGLELSLFVIRSTVRSSGPTGRRGRASGIQYTVCISDYKKTELGGMNASHEGDV